MVTIMLIIIAVVAAIYIRATLVFYYGFNNRYPYAGLSLRSAERGTLLRSPDSEDILR